MAGGAGDAGRIGSARSGEGRGRAAAQALGYKELFEHLDGKSTLEETVSRIQTRSRQLAKRQLTWFRALRECRPVPAELTLTEQILRIFKNPR